MDKPEKCEKCGGQGATWNHKQGGYDYCACDKGAAKKKDHEEQRERDRTRYINRLLKEAQIPSRFEGMGFQTSPVAPEIKDRVKHWQTGPDEDCEDGGPEWTAWCEWHKGSLYLWGSQYGSGKTGLAVATLRLRIIDYQEAGLFVTVPDLLADIRARFGDSAAVRELTESVRKIPVLLLDDIGAQKDSGWASEELFRLINYRHGAELPTIFTSNLNLEQLAERIGERTVWRIAEMSTVIEVAGPNLRDLPPAK